MYDIVILGAGPAGLATALAAQNAGLSYLVVEQGGLVDGIYRFPTHMVFFTTPELLEIGGLPFVSPNAKPTRAEALQYYRRVVQARGLRINVDERVTAILRAGETFAVETTWKGQERRAHRGRAVVVATGYYGQPNRLGVPGEDLPHVSHYFDDPHAGFGRDVVVVGGKNSAAEAALELYRAGARVTLVHRDPALGDSIKYWVKPDIENRVAEGSIAARFNARVAAITRDAVEIDGPRGTERLPAERVYLMTGYHPDRALLEAAGVTFDEKHQVAIYDPKTMESVVPGLFLAGGVVSGVGVPPVFIENGRFHGGRIVAALVERWAVSDESIV